LGILYGVVENRLNQNLPIDPIYLSSSLTPRQMSTLSKLAGQGREIQFYKKQADEFIQAIHGQREVKTTDEVAQMSPQEYDRYIASLTAKKK